MKAKKYALHSGHVMSKTDGDWHFVPAYKLAALYGVPMSECIITPHPRPDLINLYPKSNGNYTLPTEKPDAAPSFPKSQHALIYADPAWQYEMRSDKGYDKSPDAHYECMDLDAMKALRDDILFATAPNAVLVMWTTFTFIDQALDLMAAWGFQYKTGGPWVKRTATGKPAFGTGYILRSTAELFLIGTVGQPEIKNKSTRNLLLTGEWPKTLDDIDAITVDTLRREHSRKPDEMYPLIENLFPGPYLELFARTQRSGWTAWGNQTEKFTAEASCR